MKLSELVRKRKKGLKRELNAEKKKNQPRETKIPDFVGDGENREVGPDDTHTSDAIAGW